MLKYSREDSADILKDFECGIRAMDDFIHSRLDSFLNNEFGEENIPIDYELNENSGNAVEGQSVESIDEDSNEDDED